jgi:ribosomal protein S18 acetylase RimI-like enzyme
MVEQSFSIRALTVTDLPAILGVYRNCEDFLALGPVATASLEMVQQDMALSAEIGGSFCGIFDADGNMMGVVDFLAEGFEGNSQHAFIELLMIAQAYRGQGLGTAVVAHAEAEIRRHAHVKAILSGVQVNNPAAIRFWQKRGFVIESEPVDFPDGTTAYRLRKVLA